jgi:response regulator of citrate/malate metabolism
VIRVLVVDDDFMVAKLHAAWVARTPGFEVVGVAHTAEQASAAVEELTPDLLLLDVHLPDRTGLDLLQDLHVAGHEVDALIITAARDADTVQRARRRGAVDYLVKPFDHDTLTARLEQYAARVALPDAVAQSDVDVLFRQAAGRAAGLPKGLSAETVTLVSQALLDHAGDLSAAECGEATGLSRVSARRYLEHLTATGRVQVTLRYGTAGRPERRYRLRQA